MKYLCMAVLIMLSNQSFSADKVSYKEMIAINSINITKVTVGMRKEEVLKIMGDIVADVRDGPINNPWKAELNADIEVLYFITSSHPPFAPIRADQTTPIAIKDGMVVSVGREALKNIKKSPVVVPSNSSSNSVQNTVPTKTLEERLQTLKSLYDNGSIDKKTYDEQKIKILNEI